MSPVEAAIRVIIDLLVRGQYETIEKLTRGRHLSADQILAAVTGYGRHLTIPGNGWWDAVIVTPITPSHGKGFHVAAPLWTYEEGPSDLTLELRLTETVQQVFESEVLDLHVL